MTSVILLTDSQENGNKNCYQKYQYQFLERVSRNLVYTDFFS